MSKVFKELSKKPQYETEQEILKNWNEQDIEVKQYLPISEKLTLISNVLNNAHDENNFSNPVKVNLFTALEIMYAYTNINFTDKQKEDPVKLYDLLSGSKLYDKIIENIPVEHSICECDNTKKNSQL